MDIGGKLVSATEYTGGIAVTNVSTTLRVQYSILTQAQYNGHRTIVTRVTQLKPITINSFDTASLEILYKVGISFAQGWRGVFSK